MSFLQGTASDENDLLGQLVTWLTGLGWTVNMDPTVNGNAGGKRAHLSKGVAFVNLQSGLGDTDLQSDLPGAAVPLKGLMLYLSDAYDGAQPFLTQPGGPIDLTPYRVASILTTWAFAAPFGRFFAFADASDNVVVVLERRALNFASMGWGPALAKAGAWSDGRYFFAEYFRTSARVDDATPNTSADCPFNFQALAAGFVRADVDSFAGKWLACTSANGATTGNTGKRCLSGFGSAILSTDIPLWSPALGLLRLAPSRLNSQAVLVPVDLYAERDSGGSSLIGSVPNIFLTNAVGHGFAAAGDFTIGADHYLVFPGTATGYAIKKT